MAPFAEESAIPVGMTIEEKEEPAPYKKHTGQAGGIAAGATSAPVKHVGHKNRAVLGASPSGRLRVNG